MADDANTVIDTVTYGAGATIAWDQGLGAWTVKDGADTDTLYGIEKVTIGGAVHWLVDNAVDGGLESIVSALGQTGDGHTIHLAPGRYDSDVTINEGVTILGANAGKAGDDATRVAESVIGGRVTITTTSKVAIDGVKFLDDANYTLSESDNRVALTVLAHSPAGHVITNSIFERNPVNDPSTFNPNAFVGSALQPTHRGIELASVGAGAAITISNNLFSSSGNSFPYAGDAWRSAIYSNGGLGSTLIEDNAFQNNRSDINADDFSSTVVITGNTSSGSGTGVSIGVGSQSTITTITNNTWSDTDTDFNFGNLATAVTFDAGTSGNSSPSVPVADPTGTMYIVGGSAGDTITGTSGVDVIEGRNGFDSLKGGAGNDILIGGEDSEVYTSATGEGDRAVYDSTTLTIASTSTDTDPLAGGVQPGWTVTAGGGQGTDTLSGIEIVQNGSARILLVGNGGFSTIQAAIDEATNGDTILIANSATPYAGAVVNKSGITIMGESEAGVVIGGSGSGTGLDIQASGVSIENLTISNFNFGIFVGTDVNNLTIDHVTSSGHLSNWQSGSLIEKAGLWIANGADVDGLTVRDSHFDGSDYGMYFQNSLTANESTLVNVSVVRTSFNNNAVKGLYAEKLSNATFDDVEVINSGHINSAMSPAQFGAVQSGFDINLKFADYQNITIKNSDFIDSGRYFVNSGANDLAAALTVKARDDGGTYGANKATLTGLTITGNTFQSTGKVLPNGTVDASGTATEVGLRLGETNADNAAFLGTVDISGNTFKGINTAYADETTGTVAPGAIYASSALVEGTLNDVDRSGLRELGDNLIVGADPAGNAIIGGKGNDFIVGGAGNDLITWNSGDGTDTVRGDAGTGDTLVINGGATVETFTVSTTSVTSSAVAASTTRASRPSP